MSMLERAQAAMLLTLDHGPDQVPDGLFAGGRARALMGMKVHANTISHARLVALEETFPRTLGVIGHARFNESSRLYLQHPGVTALPLSHIGARFPAWLGACGHYRAEADLARFEWDWLDAYHAAEARPLHLTDLAGIDPEALLETAVQAHPAARLGRFDPVVHLVIGREVPGLDKAEAILLTRPQAEVLVSPASAAMQAVFARAQDPETIGNLSSISGAPDSADRMSCEDLMRALIAMMEAGALRRVEA